MDDQKQLLLLAFPNPGHDNLLPKRIREATKNRNENGSILTKALEGIEASAVLQMVVGPEHVAFLFKSGCVARLGFQIIAETKKESSTNSDKPSDFGCGHGGGVPSSSTTGSSSTSTTSSLSRNSKIRRVMTTARCPGTLGERAGVIVGRTRPLIPVNAIPENIIAQAQVVLQGKSRESIIRELQRTNLNVNEAVNNLLSRDDEEGDDGEEGFEAYLPDEILSLLDAGITRSDGHGGASLMDHDSLYTGADSFDYIVSRSDLSRKRNDRDKKIEKSKETPQVATTKLNLNESLQFWGSEQCPFPVGVTKFIKIAAMHSELLALGDNGFFYGWTWKGQNSGSLALHPLSRRLLLNAPSHEKFIDLVSCPYRACVVTSANRVASFLDCGSCGVRVCDRLMIPLTELPETEVYSAAYVTSMYAAIRTQTNNFFWFGIYPFEERRKIWERLRSRSRRRVTFDVNEIVEGCEVRTKSQPIYSAGSVAISFQSGVPMVGKLMESAWTLAEICRFRVQTPSQYDAERPDDGSCLSASGHIKSSLNRELVKASSPPSVIWCC
ncbi:unnamed protein product [Enterobius vermicularis]|uniref:UBA domain-containing protein n=1 Tax=Enterobius vermicularis TaxID=51028 RepID=A0A0N4UTE2_ENTVE|nr:unnamed protein product [Enterobius vermicularis]